MNAIRVYLLFIAFIFAAASSWGAEPAPRRDAVGDPLPRHALARLGTRRWCAEGGVSSLAYSGDGAMLACGCYGVNVILYHPATGRKVRTLLERTETIDPALAISADGKRLAVWLGNNIHFYDTATGAEQIRFPTHATTGIVLAPDGKHLLALHNGERALLHDDRGAVVATFERGALTAAFGRGGKTLLLGNAKRIRIWDVATKKELRRLEGEAQLLAASADGRTVAARARRAIHLWDPIRGTVRRTLAVPDESLDLRDRVLAISANGRTVALCGDGYLFAWDCETGKARLRLVNRYKDFTALALSPDGRTLAWGVRYSSIIHHGDVETGREVHPTPRHEDSVERLAFSPDGKRLGSGSNDRTVRLWDLAAVRAGRPLALELPTGEEYRRYLVSRFAWSPDGKSVALTHSDHDLCLRDAATGKVGRVLLGFRGSIYAVAISPDGRLAAAGSGFHDETGSERGRVLVWETASGRLVHTFTGHRSYVSCLAFSPDGKRLASGSDDVRIWDLPSGRRLRRLRTGAGTLAFTPDGRMMVSGSREAVVWDLANGAAVRSLGYAHRGVSGVALSPDSKRLATTGTDGVVRLWDFASGKLRAELTGHEDRVNAVAFSPDGKLLASAGTDTTILLWDVAAALRDPPRGPAPLTRAELARLWDDLGRADAAVGHRAIWALAADPAATVPYLRSRLKPKPAVDPKRVVSLVKQLDDDSFMTRQEARRQLERLGKEVLPALRAALARNPPLEVRRRIEGLLARHEGRILRRAPGEELRAARAIQVLEGIGNAEARKVLQGLKNGPPSHAAEAASEALERLDFRRGGR